MDKCKLLFKKITSNPVGFSLFSNILTLIFGCLFCRTFFEENDDLGIALITEGAYGHRDSYAVYVHNFLAKIYIALQRIVPSLRWHSILQIVFVFAAFILLGCVLCHYKNGRVMLVILEISLFYELYVSIQYTKTSAFTGFVGAAVLIHVVGILFGDFGDTVLGFTKKALIGNGVMAVILLIYSALLRKQGYVVGIIPMAIIFAVVIFRRSSDGGFKRILSYCGAWALIVVILAGVKVTDSYGIAKNGWNDYYEFEAVRVNLLDRRPDLLDYSSNGEKLSELGVSSNDAYMYVTWQIGDEGIVTGQLLSDILATGGGKKISIDFLKAFVASVYEDILVFNPVIIALFFMIFAVIYMSGMWSKSFIYGLGQAVAVVVGLVGIHYIGRWTHRLVFALLIVMTASTAYFLCVADKDCYETCSRRKSVRYDLGGTLTIIAGVLAISAFAQRLGNEFDYQEYLRQSRDFGVLQMYMEEEKDTLFVLDAFTVQDQYKYDVFNAVREGSLENVVSSGSWMTGTPIQKEVLDRFGYRDAFDALRNGGDSNVVLVDNIFAERKAGYISDHSSGPRYSAEFIENVCGYKLYKIK